MIARSRAVDGDIALSARGHVLLPRGIGLSEGGGRHFLLDRVPCVSSAITAIYYCADLERAFHQLERDDRSGEHAMHESKEVFAPAAARPGERFGRLPAY